MKWLISSNLADVNFPRPPSHHRWGRLFKFQLNVTPIHGTYLNRTRNQKMMKQIVKRVINKLGYRLATNTKFFDLEALLNFHLRKNDHFIFIQIGACDGITHDPLYQFVTHNHKKIKGIVIEPLHDFFKELQFNYKRYPNILPINTAIHNTEKEMTLYRVDPAKMKNLPKWAKGISSFNKNHHKVSGTPSDAIIEEKVQCISFDQLLQNHQIAKIDLLQVDTEGYDAEIILNINFTSIRPKIIVFEHGAVGKTMTKEAYSKVVDLLHRYDYQLIIEPYDTTAYQPNIILDL